MFKYLDVWWVNDASTIDNRHPTRDEAVLALLDTKENP